jgi:hypothetical protein
VHYSGALYLDALAQDPHRAAVKLEAKAVVTCGGPLGRVTHASVSRTSRSWVVGLRTSAPHLLDRNFFEILDMLVSSWSSLQHGSGFISTRKWESKVEPEPLYNLISVRSHHLWFILFIWSKSLGWAVFNRRGLHRARLPGDRDHWQLSYKLLAQFLNRPPKTEEFQWHGLEGVEGEGKQRRMAEFCRHPGEGCLWKVFRQPDVCKKPARHCFLIKVK